MVQDGKVVVRPMLTETMTIDFDKIGILTCFNSNGLRNLIRTTEISNMFEKTLHYPGHIDLMCIFWDAGFLNMIPILLKGASVWSIDMTASLLSPLWKYEPSEVDLTVMRLVISEEKKGRPTTYTYNIYDEYHPAT